MKTKFVLITVIVMWGIHFAYGQTSGESVDYLYAKRLYNDAMYDLAAKQFYEFAEKNPQNPQAADALLLAGDSYLKLNRYDKAREAYIYLILRFPNAKNLDQAQYNIGECLRNQGNYSEAARAFQQVKVLYPKSQLAEIALIEAARMLVLDKQYDSAIGTYYDFIEEFPRSSYYLDIQFELAKTFREKGDLKRALVEIDKILETTRDGEKRTKSLLLQADIEEELGDLFKAEESYLSMINSKKVQSKDLLAQAYFKLAAIYRKKGQYAQSNNYLSNLQLSNLDPKIPNIVKEMMGDNSFDMGEYASAIKYYQEINIPADTLNFELTYKLGMTYEKLKDFPKSIELFKRIIDNCKQLVNEFAKGYCECSYLAISRNYLHSGSPQFAINYLKNYTVEFPGSKSIDNIQYKIANIYESGLLEQEHALRLYYDFIDTFPHSRLVDNAQLGIARCYEKLQNYDQTIKEYQKYLKLYPGAEKIDEIEKRINYLSKFFIKAETGALTKFASLIGAVIAAPDQDQLTYKLALTYFNELKDYATAASLLHRCYKSPSNILPKDEILFYLANSYRNLAEKEFYEQRQSAYFDSAQINYLYLVETYPQSSYNDDAVISLLETKLLQTDSLQKKNEIIKEILSSFIDNYPTSPYLDYAYFQLGKAYLLTGFKNSGDSLNAVTQFQKVLNQYPKSKFAGLALFNQGMISLSRGNKFNAQKTLMQYIQQFPQDKEIVQAHYILAKLFAETKDYENALSYLKKITQNYFYSQYADSANDQISNIYMETKDYSGGINHFLQLKDDYEIPCNWNNSETTNYEQEIIFKLGQFYQQLGDRQQAMNYYHDYLKRFPTGTHIPDVLLYLAELFNTNIASDREMGLSFLNRLLHDFPDNSYKYPANVYAGDILFKKNEYLAAREHYLNSIKWSANEKEKLYPTMQAIICLYKADQVGNADEEVKQFKKSYKEIDDYLGQIELAKGDYYFDRKFFETAENIYKSVRSDFKKTTYGPKAELSLGKLYLTLNRDEDALKILTDMPKKYGEDPIIPEVYLVLGEFYYLKARQPENAMLAFKTAIDHPAIEGALLAKGMSYLIRCYFDLRLWDQALVLSRKFLERFPLSEDAFEMRIQVGIIYYYLNEYDRAIDYLRALKYEADQENEPRIQYWIGDCFMEKGQFEEAITEYFKVKYISKPTKLDWAITAIYKAGIAYMKLGKMDEAKMVFKKIIQERGPESSFGKGAQKKIDEIEQLTN